MCFQSAGDVDPADGTYTLPFETMHQEENINKCLPPSTFKSPPSPAHRTPTPALQSSHSLTCDTLPGEAENMFLELNHYEPFQTRYTS